MREMQGASILSIETSRVVNRCKQWDFSPAASCARVASAVGCAWVAERLQISLNPSSLLRSVQECQLRDEPCRGASGSSKAVRGGRSKETEQCRTLLAFLTAFSRASVETTLGKLQPQAINVPAEAAASMQTYLLLASELGKGKAEREQGFPWQDCP